MNKFYMSFEDEELDNGSPFDENEQTTIMIGENQEIDVQNIITDTFEVGFESDHNN